MRGPVKRVFSSDSGVLSTNLTITWDGSPDGCASMTRLSWGSFMLEAITWSRSIAVARVCWPARFSWQVHASPCSMTVRPKRREPGSGPVGMATNSSQSTLRPRAGAASSMTGAADGLAMRMDRHQPAAKTAVPAVRAAATDQDGPV